MEAQAQHEAISRLGVAPWFPTAEAIAKAADQLDVVQRGVRTRTLDRAALDLAVKRYMAAVTMLTDNGLDPSTLRVEIHGGCVPNSYKYAAEATWITLVAAPGLTGAGGWRPISATRGRARSASHGKSWSCRATVKLDSAEIGGAPGMPLCIANSWPRRWSAGEMSWRWA